MVNNFEMKLRDTDNIEIRDFTRDSYKLIIVSFDCDLENLKNLCSEYDYSILELNENKNPSKAKLYHDDEEVTRRIQAIKL